MTAPRRESPFGTPAPARDGPATLAHVLAALDAADRGDELDPDDYPAQAWDDVVGRIAALAVRAAADDARQRRQQRYVERLLEATAEGVYVQDEHGTVTYANDAAARILGHRKESLVGRPAHETFHAPGPRGSCPVEAVGADALPRASLTTFRDAAGRVVPVDANVSPVVVDGVLAEVICVFEDASARAADEAARERALQAERDLSQRKTDLVNTISHEFRTPLTSVRGYLELVLDGDAGEISEEVEAALRVVERNTVRLQDQVEAFLLVTRIESGAVNATKVVLDLTAVVADALDAIRPVAEAKGVTLVPGPVVGTPRVVGDSAQLDRVLLNLLSNAVKFTPAGGEVYLDVTTHPTHVEVEVADTGMGIPADEQPRLFEKFFRSSISQRQEVQGTGLGLAIVKTIVEDHGGRIAVVSEEGAGTTVAFSLPAAADRT